MFRTAPRTPPLSLHDALPICGDPDRECRCTPQQIARYRGRLSGPLRDRLDLAVELPAVPPDLLGTPASGESSASVRARVTTADRKSTRLNSSHRCISYAVFCL